MMHEAYNDIRSRLGDPLWWDENGCPRYDPFDPGMCADAYAEEAILVRIRCQNCDEEFDVADTWSPYSDMFSWRKLPKLSERIRAGGFLSYHWGDPPYHDDPAGNTENCIDMRVLQFWTREKTFEWSRDTSLEIDLWGEREGKDW
jgi:hypothetical protein